MLAHSTAISTHQSINKRRPAFKNNFTKNNNKNCYQARRQMGNEQSVLDEETREPEKWRNKLKQHIAAHRAKAMLEKAEEEAEAVVHKQYLCENSLADQLQLNPVLTETLFSGIITACDLSYATSSIARYGTSDMQVVAAGY